VSQGKLCQTPSHSSASNIRPFSGGEILLPEQTHVAALMARPDEPANATVLLRLHAATAAAGAQNVD